MKSSSKIKLLMMAVLLTIALATPSLAATKDCGNASESSYRCWINLTVYRWDTGNALSGVVVTNLSNTSQTFTTGADGQANISYFTNRSTHTLEINSPAGYIDYVTENININGGDNETYTVSVIPAIPVNSAITEASITRTGGTVSWTVNHSTVGNRIVYSYDSNLLTNLFYTAWGNSTASPSFVISNLDIYKKLYYRLESYNTVNSTYNATSTGDFTTLHGYAATSPKQYVVTIPSTPTESSPISRILGSQNNQNPKGNNTGKIIVFVGIVAILYLLLKKKK